MSLASHVIEACKAVDDVLGRPLARRATGPRRPLPPHPTDILVVRLWGLGNLVLMAGLLAAQLQRGLRVRLLTLARHEAFLARHLPQLEVLGLPKPGSPRLLLALAARLAELRQRPPDLIVDAETFLKLPTALLRLLLDAPIVGQDTPGQGRGPLLDRALAYDPTRHVAHTCAALFALGGLDATAAAPLGWSQEAATSQRLRARLGLEAGAPLVLLHPGSGDHFPGRRWAPARFAALAGALARDGAAVALTGSKTERGLCQGVARASGAAVLDLSGAITGDGLAELLLASRLLVTNDTGPLHLADALAVPVVGLFGPNTPHRYGPRRPGSVALFADLPCSPCLDDRLAKRSRCQRPLCMEALDTGAVLAACRSILAGSPELAAAATLPSSPIREVGVPLGRLG